MPYIKNELTTKAKIQYASSIFMLIVGSFCIIASLFIPPHGVIDSSVLYFAGLVLAFVAGVFGVDIKFTSQLAQLREQLEREMDRKIREQKEDEEE